MGRGAWWAAVHGVTKSQTQLSDFSLTFYFMHCRRKWQPTPVFLPGESQGRGSLVGCCLWGCTESDTTERLHFHFSLSCIGEGNGNPLQCSCLENPRDGGVWWAAVYGIAQSRTRLKRLSSSSSINKYSKESRLPTHQLRWPPPPGHPIQTPNTGSCLQRGRRERASLG